MYTKTVSQEFLKAITICKGLSASELLDLKKYIRTNESGNIQSQEEWCGAVDTVLTNMISTPSKN